METSVKQNAMAVLCQCLETRKERAHSLVATLGGTPPEAVHTRSTMVYSCFPCDAAWMSHSWVAGACVASRRSTGGHVVKHYSMFTGDIPCVPVSALVRHVRRVRASLNNF